MTTRTAHCSKVLLFGRPRVVGYSRVSNPTVSSNHYSKRHPWQSQTMTPDVLVRMLFYFNERKGFQPNRPRRAYLREAKKLIDKVGPSHAETLMLEAYRYAKHPWGIKFLETLQEEKKLVIEDEQSPLTIMGIEL